MPIRTIILNRSRAPSAIALLCSSTKAFMRASDALCSLDRLRLSFISEDRILYFLHVNQPTPVRAKLLFVFFGEHKELRETVKENLLLTLDRCKVLDVFAVLGFNDPQHLPVELNFWTHC